MGFGVPDPTTGTSMERSAFRAGAETAAQKVNNAEHNLNPGRR